MSDTDEESSIAYVDSPPISPGDPASSPLGKASEEENDADDPSNTSPPSSPVRKRRKCRSNTERSDLETLIPHQNASSTSKKCDMLPIDFSGGFKASANQQAAHVFTPSDNDGQAYEVLAGALDEGSVDDDVGEEDCQDPPSDNEPESGASDIVSLSDGELSSADSDGCGLCNEQELSDSDGNEEDPFNDLGLYPGCEKTTDEAIYDLINIYLCNNLSQTALRDILKFHISTLPALHNMPSSHHRLLKYIQDLSVPLFEIEHYYCRPAQHPVTSRTGPCDCGSSDIGVFFELPLDKRIQFLFEQRGLADVIDKYAEVRKQDGTIRDILDGSEYKRVWEGTLEKYKVTLILNTDGVSPHKSSKAKFWPLLFTFMEIPPELRPSFTVVWGLWFDKKLKPNMNHYLEPFVASLQRIEQVGCVLWKHPRTQVGERSPIRCCLLVADAPARAGCLNIQEHQAKYACPFCQQKTNKLPVPPVIGAARQPPRKRRFLFLENPSPLMINDGEIAAATYQPKRGHKGPTVMGDIPSVKLSTCTLAEYMHCVLLGVVRQICSLWLFVPGEWFIGESIPAMNEFLDTEVHLPDFVSRLPRSFEYFAFFKANEFRSFLLYFSLIIVKPYLSQRYHQHWMLLVHAMFLLLSDSISETDCIEAEILMRLFVRDLGTLYGDKQYVYNVHQLVHLVLHVRRWGPLWATSAFSFENCNGILSKMLHGSKNEGQELLNQLSLAQGAQILKNRIVTNATVATRNAAVLGKPLHYVLSVDESQLLNNVSANADLLFYGRVLIGRNLFSSEEYDRQFKRRNSYIELKYKGQKKYGRIIVFCKSGRLIVCLVKVFRVNQSKFFFHTATMTRIRHIVPVEDSGEIIVCDVQCLKQKLIQVGDFLCYRPNLVESNL